MRIWRQRWGMRRLLTRPYFRQENTSLLTETDGVTLIELCIASGIMAVCFLFLIGGIVDMHGSNEIVAGRTLAQAQLMTVMEQMRAMPFETLMAYSPTPVAGLGDSATISVSVVNSSGQLVSLPITNTAVSSALPNPLEVRATITWRDSQGRLYTRQLASRYRR